MSPKQSKMSDDEEYQRSRSSGVGRRVASVMAPRCSVHAPGRLLAAASLYSVLTTLSLAANDGGPPDVDMGGHAERRGLLQKAANLHNPWQAAQSRRLYCGWLPVWWSTWCVASEYSGPILSNLT